MTAPHRDASPLSVAESSQFEHLTLRLVDAFPDLPEREVREAVAIAVADLDGARLRHFVPLLVERAAKAECRRRRGTAKRAEQAADDGEPPTDLRDLDLARR